MYAKNLFATAHIRTAHHHAPVKPTRPQQCGIEHVRTVGRRHQNDAFVRLKAVHLDQQLIQSLFALVVSAAQASAAMTSHRIDLVDEDNAGSVLLALLEKIAHAAGADANKHLHKIRTRNREERNIRLARNRAGQQRLARSRRPNQQHALRNASAQLLELLRLAQKLDNLAQLFFGLFHASHVFERNFLLLHGEQSRPALAKRQRLVSTGLHLPDHEEPQRAQQNQRSPGAQQLQGQASAVDVAEVDVHSLGVQVFKHFRSEIVHGERGMEGGAVAILAANFHAINRELANVVLVDVTHELSGIDFFVFLAVACSLNDFPEQ